jgi:hypothetical protein
MSEIIFASKRAMRHAIMEFKRCSHDWLLDACNTILKNPSGFIRRWYSISPPNPDAHKKYVIFLDMILGTHVVARALSFACDASASTIFQDHLEILRQELQACHQEYYSDFDSAWELLHFHDDDIVLENIIEDFCNKYRSKTRFNIHILLLLAQYQPLKSMRTPSYWFERFTQTMIHSCPLDQVSELVSDVSKTTLMDPFLTVVKKLVRLEIDHVAFWGTEFRFNAPLWHKFMQIVPTYVFRECENLRSSSNETVGKLESLKRLLSTYETPSIIGKRRRRGRKRLK